MTEQHEHKWMVSSARGMYLAICNALDVNGQATCSAELTAVEIDKRLNEYEKLKRATDVLTAEDASELATFAGFALLDVPERGRSPSIGKRIEAAHAYADALAG